MDDTEIRDWIALALTLGLLLGIGFKVPIPDRMWDIYMLIIGFFFGSKKQTGGSNVQKNSTVFQKPILQDSGKQASPGV